MESAAGTSPPPPAETTVTESPPTHQRVYDYVGIAQELQSLRRSYEELQSRNSAMGESLNTSQKQRDEALKRNSDLELAVYEASLERDLLRDLIRQLDVFCREKQCEIDGMMFDEMSRRKGLETEVEIARGRIEKLESEIRDKDDEYEVILQSLLSLLPIRNKLSNILAIFEDLKCEHSSVEEADEEMKLKLTWEEEMKLKLTWEISTIRRLASEAEGKAREFKKRKEEKKELEDSIVSLTEENRDLNSFLRAALMEKEAVERNLSRLKGNTEPPKRTALLQIAERGLQSFRFMIGSSSSSDQTMVDSEPSGASNERRSDGGESDEEIVSLASTIERVTKNLRMEITQLKRSLEDSRSDCERLQSLVDKQAQNIAEKAIYVTELKDRERSLAKKVEELRAELKETEAEAERWMEACELEVEAGKKEVAERDKVIWIMKQELEKTRAELEISNGKLKLKEEVADAAMAAQAASEKSLQLADTRASEFRNRMEELSRQLEEATEGKDRVRRKVRHKCWPWRGFRDSMNDAGRRRLPEMQALLP